MENEFKVAHHTIIVSDMHISDAEPPHPRNPLWKRFKRPKHFIDRSFRRLLEYLQEEIETPIELIFNGDIFDFDSCMQIPERPEFHVSWLERSRGLRAEEPKSCYKMDTILRDHPVFVETLRTFILAGNRVVFIIGNHDGEMHWPSVQQRLLNALNLPEDAKSRMRFCEWFYVSNSDTLIEHGNQYDAYCLVSNPVHPLIMKRSKVIVRLPFGNLANKYMVNGMGLINPHMEASFIMPFKQYLVFFYRYVMRVQPFIFWHWLWGALVTLYVSLSEGLLPPLKDPLTIEQRIEDISQRSNSTPRVVRSLREIHEHPAIFNPFKILRELWLDRALLFVLIVFGSFQFFSFLKVFVNASIWWFIIPVVILMPVFIFYAQSVESDIYKTQEVALANVPFATQMVRVKRAIHGHTHREMHTIIQGVEVLNTGTWSPAFHDVECTRPYGRKCFAWIMPNAEGTGRLAQLCEWKDPGIEVIPQSEYTGDVHRVESTERGTA